MKIGVVGGGLMGLAIAYRLSQLGHTVSVFEASDQLGGLTTHKDYGTFTWDKFYHVILPSDIQLISFLSEIGLAEELTWQKTYTGYFIDRKLFSISNTAEFFRFPLLSLYGKLRLAFTLLYGARIDQWQTLEKVSVEQWLLKFSGEKTYLKFWKPLLLAKLGENYKRVSAVFIWSYIKRLFSARSSSLSKEQLGYVSGGYKAVFDRLSDLISKSGGEVKKNAPVIEISPDSENKLWLKTEKIQQRFDKIIFAGPINVLEKVAKPDLLQLAQSDAPIEYLGVVCMVLLTRQPIVPFYVVNIADQDIPFTGVIGMSTVVSHEETGGLYMTYLPKYVASDDAWLQKTNEEIQTQFLQGLQLMFPDYDLEDIVSIHVHRAQRVQPLQVIDYSKIVPDVTTTHRDLLISNTAQFVNDTLNNNTVIRHAEAFVETHFKAAT